MLVKVRSGERGAGLSESSVARVPSWRAGDGEGFGPRQLGHSGEIQGKSKA